MKKLLATLLIAAAVSSIPTGCLKSDIGSTISPLNTLPLNELPNLSNFLIRESTAFVAGAQAVVQVFSTSMNNGTYTVNYNITGNNTISGSAPLVMYKGSGSFSTSIIPSPGPSTITITSITDSAGSSTPSANNVSSMFDSTGVMGATYTSGTKDTTWQFNTNQVTAQLAGTLLTIHGVMWTPNLTTITLIDNNYTGTAGTISWTMPAAPAGGADYGVAGSGIAIADISAHGSYTITSTSPVLTGTFKYTNEDSSTVIGTFTAPKP